MVKKRIILFIFVFIAVFFINGCSEGSDEPAGTKVIYNLEGGVFQNCTLPIKQYYQINGESCLITDPETLTKDKIIRTGYVLEGWYTDNTFSNKWDFSKDKIDENGITLYAKWEKLIKYSYNVCYKDEDNKVVVINSYSVNAGDKFEDWANYAKKRTGYTPLGFYDEKDKEWDENFKHPGGDKDLAINVYVKYLKGNYSIVSTAKELINSKNKNIYLVNDIDLQGESFSFNNYINKDFIGNGHTISNFKVQYDSSLNGLEDDFNDKNVKSLYISIFDNIENSSIKNVNFENVSYVVDTTFSRITNIYVVPLATKIINSKIENVTISGEYSYKTLPSNPFNKETNLFYYTTKEQIGAFIDNESTFTNNEILINIGEGNNE